jgi:hypothetical protein
MVPPEATKSPSVERGAPEAALETLAQPTRPPHLSALERPCVYSSTAEVDPSRMEDLPCGIPRLALH